jgi:hypothetical protein
MLRTLPAMITCVSTSFWLAAPLSARNIPDPPTDISEPSMLSLWGAGLAVAIVIWRLKGRK